MDGALSQRNLRPAARGWSGSGWLDEIGALMRTRLLA